MNAQALNDCVAGIVTFNPDISVLKENLLSVAPQVRIVFLFDNGSDNVGEVRQVVEEFDKARLMESNANLGVATALNRICTAALEAKATWLVTLDQDSVCAPDMVGVLLRQADESTPLVTPFIIDRNKLTLDSYLSMTMPTVQYYRRAASKGAITSGCLLKLHVWQSMGGFDDLFFIDYVDYDFNMRLMRNGYRIARANQTYLLHEVGAARKTWLRTPRKSLDGEWHWETFYSFGHSPTRCFYKARNRVLYTRKHWRHIKFSNEGVLQIPQQVFLTMVFERDRLTKLRAFISGFRDGLRTPIL
ncbi:glycosyltransferase [Mycolicibacterium neoaurum]|uniref:glycosyltransferase n=1 Tax=Mycolicibacterium neoaurum TaxID=1795 RepID=UPI001BCD5380|nr:glycosyltransferase [Mycolicibacterium neoaurum]QVI27575.1 glycosyltransferase [Mycolicibacterium neoaurum]